MKRLKRPPGESGIWSKLNADLEEVRRLTTGFMEAEEGQEVAQLLEWLEAVGKAGARVYNDTKAIERVIRGVP